MLHRALLLLRRLRRLRGAWVEPCAVPLKCSWQLPQPMLFRRGRSTRGGGSPPAAARGMTAVDVARRHGAVACAYTLGNWCVRDVATALRRHFAAEFAALLRASSAPARLARLHAGTLGVNPCVLWHAAFVGVPPHLAWLRCFPQAATPHNTIR
jgi:hypothetical protein